ncbi:MAG: Uncharacterized protein FD166_2938 [Bacteroidetes bacterium]|nr:MAG: Uncharacterized protein FD166_2938 [Bacteroidota bacterium]
MPDYELNKRLGMIIEAMKMNPLEFSKAYNDTKAVKTYHILNNRNGISSKMLDSILQAYPQISRTWLLTGEGSMFITGLDAYLPMKAFKYIMYKGAASGMDEFEKRTGITKDELESGMMNDPVEAYKRIRKAYPVVDNMPGTPQRKTEQQNSASKADEGNLEKLIDLIVKQQDSISKLSDAALIQARNMERLLEQKEVKNTEHNKKAG